ncbi:hypothetical protein KPL70_019011 [Citrus sinensis]|nr:hypothetical protein KPL70_019011 [Citrus sinensis]
MEEVSDMEEEKGLEERPKSRDVRRYYCDYCGICRSKKSLILSHIASHHKEDEERVDGDGETKGVQCNTCEECGASFKKPAYLKQHMLSHLLEVGRPPEKLHQWITADSFDLLQRPFRCSADDCHASYRRKDHLTRHLLRHQGKLFKCPIENCNREFTIQGNMKRHVKELHHEGTTSTDSGDQKQYICQEIGCGKVFKYASKLRQHEDSHVNLDSVEAFCSEPGCMKYFTNKQCLEAHIRSCHQYIPCEICGSMQLKKNIKRHVRTHEARDLSERIKCQFKGCLLSFSTNSNLRQHVKAVHYEIKPFACSFFGCGMRFAFKHVRDNHEKSGHHVYSSGDFVESDERFRSRERGGRKRKCPTVEMLIRKRVSLPSPTQSCNLYED